jgi:hypothetical protein
MDTIHRLAAILHRSEHDRLAGSFLEIVLQMLDDLEKKETECFQQFFDCVEQELIFSERSVQDAIIIELLEELKNQATWRDVDYAIFEDWLGPETHVAWRWLEKKWQGKRSLADSTRTSPKS